MQRKVVDIPIADLRAQPDHRSERVSQATYGSLVTILTAGDEFSYLTLDDDKYKGWIANSYLTEPTNESGQSYLVVSNFAYFSIAGSDTEFILPHGSRIIKNRETNQFVEYRNLQGMILVSGEVFLIAEIPKSDPVSIARQFLSVPYLWGGISTYGFDCSGLIQTIFRRCGKTLPRDTKDQEQVGNQVSPDQSRPGDLVFFPGHVALYIDSSQIIHASRQCGLVVIESLDPQAVDFRPDLAGKITSVRRIDL